MRGIGEDQALLSKESDRESVAAGMSASETDGSDNGGAEPLQSAAKEPSKGQEESVNQPALLQPAGHRSKDSQIAEPAESSDALSIPTLQQNAEDAVSSASRNAVVVAELASSDDRVEGVGPSSPRLSRSDEGDDESAALMDAGKGECRICQEEDLVASLETPCACSGSVKYAHRKCVQRWCNEKGNAVCEICHEPYKGGYVVAPRRQLLTSEEIPPELREELALPFGRRTLLPRDSRVYAVRDGGRLYLEVEYEEYTPPTVTGAAWCRAAALILLAMLLMRHAFATVGSTDEDDDPGMFTLFMLRVIGILLPCYVMARALSMLRRPTHEEDGSGGPLLDSNVTLVLQPRQVDQSEVSRMARLPPSGAPLVQNQA